MIDLKKFRENPDVFEKGAKDKGVNINFERFKELDETLRNKKAKIDELNSRRNSISKEIEELKKNSENADEKVKEVKELKESIDKLQEEYDNLYKEFYDIYIEIPLPSQEDVPYGKDDDENKELNRVGDVSKFDFTPLTHWELLEKRGLLDQERSAKVSGTRFYYIREGLVELELALVNYAMNKMISKGFSPTIGPNLVKEKAMYATGFFPADKNEIYSVNPGEDNLFLIGTSEVSMVAQHMNETFSFEDLPLRYVSFSPCYRREAGSYGKDTKGMIRVHQFEKVEMVSFTKPEDSFKEHEMLNSIEEEIYQELGIPYRKMLICTGDLGVPASKKYDLEAYLPGEDKFKEITSCSNCEDFQTRRANIKIKDGNNKELSHSLNGTAIALGRTIVAIVENYQNQDLTINVPEILKPYLNKEII